MLNFSCYRFYYEHQLVMSNGIEFNLRCLFLICVVLDPAMWSHSLWTCAVSCASSITGGIGIFYQWWDSVFLSIWVVLKSDNCFVIVIEIKKIINGWGNVMLTIQNPTLAGWLFASGWWAIALILLSYHGIYVACVQVYCLKLLAFLELKNLNWRPGNLKLRSNFNLSE